jgi:transposase
VLEPEGAARTCARCATAKTRIGEDITEELEYAPAVLWVHEYVRPKYACPQCEAGVVQAGLPARPIEQGRPGPGLLAQVVTAKYADHAPLHRQEGIFARSGVALSRRTLCDWVAAVAELVAPIVGEMQRTVLTSHVIHSDDTPITVLDRGHPGGSRRGYLWVYGGEQGDLVYDYTPSRSRAGPVQFLAGFHGYLQADAYAGYDAVFASGVVTEVACWAHARRYVFEAVQTALEPATHLLALIRRLYAVERAAQGAALDGPRRQALRAAESRPVLAGIEEEIARLTPTVLPKSPFGEALGYLRRQWRALTRYTDDGALAIDNNASERALRLVAVGRKNWMFAGSDAGGRRAALLYSLIGTCKHLRIDPFVYLRDVISRVATHPMRRIAELTPRGWQAQRLLALAAP